MTKKSNNVVFYNRNFSGVVPQRFDISVERYSHAMIGGPDTAILRVRPFADKWELTKLLRCPVEIYGADGGLKWWGYVNRVTLPHNQIRAGLGLDTMYNSINVKYDGGTTSLGLDQQSITEYGTKEFQINLSNASAAEAAAYRDNFLGGHKYPTPELELSGSQGEIIIECYGWWRSLDWKYYSNTAITPIENTTQITAIVATCGQFVNGVIIEHTAGLLSTPTRDGSGSGLQYVTELLNAGSSNARPLLAYVDKDRYIHVYERVAETTEYIMRDDANLETLLGQKVDVENCVSAKWVRIKGVPDTVGGISAMRPFFIDRAEYVAPEQATHYSSAGAFEQERLTRYLQQTISTGTGGVPWTIPDPGYGGSPPITTTDDPSVAIVIEATLGLLYTQNYNAEDPTTVLWEVWTTGLTTPQYQSIRKLMICNSGAVYVVSLVAGANAFVARAPALGEPFTVIFDYAFISALFSGSSDNIRVAAIGQDKTAAEFVLIALSQGGENNKFFISSGWGAFTQCTAFVTVTSGLAEISYGELHWMFTALGYVVTFNGAMTATTLAEPWGPAHMTRHRRVAATGVTYHWDDDGATTAKGLGKGEDNGEFFTNNIGDNLDSNRLYEDRVVCDDITGDYFMTRNNTPNPVRSFDGGENWEVMSALLPAGASWFFECVYGSTDKWGAAGGGKVQHTDDFGSSWEDRTGNMTTLIASPDLYALKFYPLTFITPSAPPVDPGPVDPPSPGTFDHALLTHLGYADAAHTGFTPSTRTISTTAPLTGGGDLSANRTIAIPAATSLVNGYLTSADWVIFNAKQAALTLPLSAANGGTGIANGASASLTLPNAATTITGGGTLALGGFTLTVPATGTAALLATANLFTANQRINALVGINAAPLSYSQLTMQIATPGNYGLILLNSAGKYDILVDDSGGMQFGNTTLIGFNTATTSSGYSSNIDGKTFQIQNSNVFSSAEYAVAVMSAVDATYTTGNGGMLRVTGRYKVTSGDGIWNTAAITPYIDQTGATGDIVGIWYYPTITNKSGTHYSIKTESGMAYLRNETTANNAILETLRVESSTQLGATGAAAGFGTGIELRSLTATAYTEKKQGRLWSKWIVATNGSETSAVGLDAYTNSTAQEFISGEGNAAGVKLALYGGTRVARGAALTTQLTTITFTAPGTPDYAIQDFVDVSLGVGWAFANHDEANSVLKAIANLQTRCAELEARLGSATGINAFA